jgi:hypothetical protein
VRDTARRQHPIEIAIARTRQRVVLADADPEQLSYLPSR